MVELNNISQETNSANAQQLRRHEKKQCYLLFIIICVFELYNVS